MAFQRSEGAGGVPLIGGLVQGSPTLLDLGPNAGELFTRKVRIVVNLDELHFGTPRAQNVQGDRTLTLLNCGRQLGDGAVRRETPVLHQGGAFCDVDGVPAGRHELGAGAVWGVLGVGRFAAHRATIFGSGSRAAASRAVCSMLTSRQGSNRGAPHFRQRSRGQWAGEGTSCPFRQGALSAGGCRPARRGPDRPVRSCYATSESGPDLCGAGRVVDVLRASGVICEDLDELGVPAAGVGCLLGSAGCWSEPCGEVGEAAGQELHGAVNGRRPGGEHSHGVEVSCGPSAGGVQLGRRPGRGRGLGGGGPGRPWRRSQRERLLLGLG